MMGEELIQKARALVEDGKFDQALVNLRRLESEFPQDPDINQLLGHIAYRSGDTEEAGRRLLRAYELFDQKGEIIQAIGCLEELILLDPSPDRYLALADLYDRIGLKGEAQSRLFTRGTELINAGDIKNGLQLLEKICYIDAENLHLRLILGKMFLYSGDEDRGRSYLKELRELAVSRGMNEIVSEIDTLIAETDGGEELDPKSRIELANLLSEIGSAQEAIAEYLVAASDLLAQERNEEARKVLRRVLELDPNNVKAKEELEKLGEEEVKVPVEEQEEVSEPGVEESELPPIEAIEGQVADIEFLLKEVESKPVVEIRLSDLIEEFRSRMRELPERPETRLKIGEILTGLLLFDLAIENYRKLLPIPELKNRAIENLGITFVRAGRYNESLRYLAEAIVARPDNLEIRYYLALAYQGMGDHENALKQLSNIISVNPNYRDARDLYQHLGGKFEEKPTEIVTEPPPPPSYRETEGQDDNIVFI